MNVLMTTDAVGGVWTYALELCRALAGRGIGVTLAALGPSPTDEQRWAARSIPAVELREGRFKLEWMQGWQSDVEAAAKWLLDLAKEANPDIVHLNQFVYGGLAWPAPTLVVGHSCVLSWHLAVRDRAAGSDWDDYRRAVTAGLQAAQLVVAPTRWMLDELERFYGPFRASQVIANGADPGRFHATIKSPLVLSAGRVWDEAKNIQALARIADSLNWPIYVAGDTRRPDGGESILKGIHSLGRLSPNELAGWYARAALYVHPAHYEPFGLAPLEAALSGCALVLNDIASLREVWGDAAEYVPAADSARLGDCLDRLIAHSERRKSLAGASRRRALTLTSERMASRYMAAYERLIHSRSRLDSAKVERSAACAW